MVIRTSGNQGVGYQGIRGSGKRIDTDLTDKNHNNSVFVSKNAKKVLFLATPPAAELRYYMVRHL